MATPNALEGHQHDDRERQAQVDEHRVGVAGLADRLGDRLHEGEHAHVEHGGRQLEVSDGERRLPVELAHGRVLAPAHAPAELAAGKPAATDLGA